MNVSIQDLFEGVAAKYLSEVDTNPKKSNQHEIGGLVKVGFKRYLGEPTGADVSRFKAKMCYLTDEDSGVEIIEDTLSWYDTRANDPARSAEYRLYYKTNAMTRRMSAGDFFLIAKLKTNELLVIACPSESTHEAQLSAIFGLSQLGAKFEAGVLSAQALSLPIVYILESLGYVFDLEHERYLDMLLSRFGERTFPNTAALSALAREVSSIAPSASADVCILDWMETEEILFRTFEKYLIEQKLNVGFGTGSAQVDNFISYSLSVQNRRKSRAGLAFEKHLEAIFKHHGLQFQQGSSSLVTEGKKKPDFLFPSFSAYHDTDFPASKLRLLGAKTSCKDRWRQVLSEGARVNKKHLITLEPAISSNQLAEMKSSALQLVVPLKIQQTYLVSERSWLLSLDDFIHEVKRLQ
ncbi:MAG: type II restriction endonuclease [Thiomicrospira sp.]|jgi:hypothetical protein|nr:type II restriction endonuclease [Thiomicrospira sp.]